MQILETLITIIHVFVCFFLILVVLLQSGRGGGMGAAFGGGASTQIFGGRGAGSFLARITTGAAVVFMLTALSLSYLSSKHRSVVEDKQPGIEDTGGGEEGAAEDSADAGAGEAEEAGGMTSAPKESGEAKADEGEPVSEARPAEEVNPAPEATPAEEAKPVDTTATEVPAGTDPESP